MSLKRQIKTQLILFVVLLAAFVSTFLYLFQKNYHQFNVEIYSRSKENLEIIDALSKIDTNLYIHKKSLFRYVNTDNDKWLNYLKDAQVGIEQQFKFLENYNKNEFQMWVPVEDFFVNNGRAELEKQIIEFQKGRSGDGYFQRLFYLVRFNIEQYFKQSEALIKKHGDSPVVNQQIVLSLDDEDAYVKLIYSGINQLVTAYNNKFWDYAQSQNSKYHRNTNYYFRTLLVSSILLLLFAVFILVRILRYFYHQQLKNENLALLGAKDLVTGLFNKRSFEILGGQELERAKRRGYHLSFLVVKIDPFEAIQNDLGPVAVDRLMFQVAELLRKSVRSYDGIFKFEENSFVVMLSETDFKTINMIVERFKVKFFKTSFVVKKSKMKVIPQVSVGFAIYPTDADKLEGLIQFAVTNMSADFDAFTSHPSESKVGNVKTISKTSAESDKSNGASSVTVQSDHHVEETQNQTDLNVMFETASKPEQKSDDEVVAEAPEEPVVVPSVPEPVVDEVVIESEPEVVKEDAEKWAPKEDEAVNIASDESVDHKVVDEKVVVEAAEEIAEETVEEIAEEVAEKEVVEEEVAEENSDKGNSQKLMSLSEEESQKLISTLEKDDEPASSDQANVTENQENSDLPIDVPDVVAALNQDGVTVMETEEEEDVITVDFDKEPEDLAMNFRRKQRQKRQK